MKPANHQETHTTIEEIPSNNRDTNKKENKVCDLKAGYNQDASLSLNSNSYMCY